MFMALATKYKDKAAGGRRTGRQAGRQAGRQSRCFGAAENDQHIQPSNGSCIHIQKYSGSNI